MCESEEWVEIMRLLVLNGVVVDVDEWICLLVFLIYLFLNLKINFYMSGCVDLFYFIFKYF